MTCTVTITILAKPEIVWSVLTNAAAFPQWNSTVSALEGQIRDGERLKLRAPGTSRVFTPVVSGMIPNRSMVWRDGVSGIFRGVRTFTLAVAGDSTRFSMSERLSGLMFALTKTLLPDFEPIFLSYAADLKREAEKLSGNT